MTQSKRDLGHAIVIGGSIAGLCAARALREHFGRVTVIERDALDPDKQSDSRPGAPQSRHAHVLLDRGRQLLERFYPGLAADADADGVPLLAMGHDLLAVLFGRRVPAYDSRYTMRSCSRAWLEGAIRKHTQVLPGITLANKTEATGLHAATSGSVTGVAVRRADGTREVLTADLIVDASGRSSKAVEWLRALGYEAPAVTTINPQLSYSTRWYEAPKHSTRWRAVLVGALAHGETRNSRGAYLGPVEGGRWVVTLSGLADQQPPRDEAGFLEFSRQLVDPVIYEALQGCKPLSAIYGYQRTENRWVHFERMKRWPERLIVLGDAAVCFNPVHGQGMTVAAIQADALDRALSRSRSLRGFARAFQRKHVPAGARAAWQLSTADDFRWPTTQGGKPDLATRIGHWYIDRLVIAGMHKPAVMEAFNRVYFLISPATEMLKPSFVALTLRHVVRGWLSEAPEPAAEAQPKWNGAQPQHA